MDPILKEFLEMFRASFNPPVPYRGRSGKTWFVSRVWSVYMKDWLQCHYSVKFECPLKRRRRLDAAIWPKTQNQHQGRMDIALEWEWDNNKVASDFLRGDFRKCLEVDAKCGLVIVQTRADGKRGLTQSDGTVSGLLQRCNKYRRDSRSAALIEIRRVFQQKERVEFVIYFQDLDTPTKLEIGRWSYHRDGRTIRSSKSGGWIRSALQRRMKTATVGCRFPRSI